MNRKPQWQPAKAALVYGRATLLIGLLATALVALVSAASAPAFEAPSEVGPCPGSGCFAAPNADRIAVEEASGDIYAINSSEGVVTRYDANGTPDGLQLSASGMTFEGGTASCDAIAVDNSNAQTKGNVYVVSGFNELFAFDKEGKFLWKRASQYPCGVAVDSEGHVWLADFLEDGVHPGYLQELNPADGSTVSSAAGFEGNGSLAFDAANEFIAAAWNGPVYKLDGNGTKFLNFPPGVGASDVAVDLASDLVYATAPGARLESGILVWTDTGTLLTGTPFNPEGFGPEKESESGLAVDNQRHRLLLSTVTGRVYIFDILEPSLTVSTKGSGRGNVTCNDHVCESRFYDKNEITFEANLAPGSELSGWKVNGSPACGASLTCTVTLEGDSTVEADLTAVDRKLEIAKLGSEEGEIASQPAGIECGSGCTGQTMEFGEYEFIVLTATPPAHYHLAGWSGCDSVTAGECELVLTGDRSISAQFAPTMRQLTVNTTGTGSGSVTCQVGVEPAAPCAGEYRDGTVVTLTASPESGSSFTGFSGGGCSGAAPCTFALTANTTMTATFNAPPKGEEPAAKPAEAPVTPPTEKQTAKPTSKPTGKLATKRVTRDQLLARAIKQCKKLAKHRRAACVKKAKKRFAPSKRKRK